MERIMYIEELKTFIHLAKTKNFTKTAKECHLAQSTVSNRVKSLEERFEITLFSRNNKRVVLTQAGIDFQSYAERLIAIHQDAMKQLHTDSQYRDILKLGLTYSVYNAYLKQPLLEFAESNQRCALDLKITPSDAIFESIQDQLIDLAFVSHRIPSSNLVFQKISSDRIACVTSPKNKEHVNGITIEELKLKQVLYCDILPIKLFGWFKSIFGKSHTFKIKINVLHEIIPYVSRLNSYCFIPFKLVEELLDCGELIEVELLDSVPPVLEYFMVRHKNATSKDLVDEFLDYFLAK